MADAESSIGHQAELRATYAQDNTAYYGDGEGAVSSEIQRLTRENADRADEAARQ